MHADNSSPHTRRYFQPSFTPTLVGRLFSAHAEVFPGQLIIDIVDKSLLRTRGGISNQPVITRTAQHSSPHTRRYFQRISHKPADNNLFSAHAEVFPKKSGIGSPAISLLRTRGGISGVTYQRRLVPLSSPHTRRYFLLCELPALLGCLFSAHAEVFPDTGSVLRLGQALLRTRGGISRFHRHPSLQQRSSPHTRRYFPPPQPLQRAGALFSAHAEVFPRDVHSRTSPQTLLRTRGGISSAPCAADSARTSSPHTRRYFRKRPHRRLRHQLFSAHAEVFPVGSASPPK